MDVQKPERGVKKMPWTFAIQRNKVQEQPQVVKIPPRQIALFAVKDAIHAIDNRCPHEGYPLVKGTIDADCVLTCNWHNWKFRLSDGECTLGGDHVRSYAVEVRGEDVWVNTDDPPSEVLLSQIIRGLRAAFDERDFGRICREIARIRFNGLAPKSAVCAALDWTCERLEYGFTHAFAVAPDWLLLADVHHDDFSKQLTCFAECVDHMAWDSLRHQQYPYSALNQAFDEGEFVQAIESEDAVRAESMATASVGTLRWDEVEHAFASAALAHFNDFGHSLIYVFKSRQLLERLGDEAERPIRLALARHLAYTTREDLLPEFSEYAAAAETLATRPLQFLQHSQASKQPLDPPYPASVREALAWVLASAKDHSIEQVYDRLLLALAQNLLHFETSVDEATHRPVTDNVGWLDFTHGLTFANAVRHICGRHPDLWPAGLLQMALFVGRNRAYIDQALDVTPWQVDDEQEFFLR